MLEIEVTKLNESYSCIKSDPDTMVDMREILKVKDESLKYDRLVQAGFGSEYKYFADVQNGHLVVQNGHLSLLKMYYPTLEFEPQEQSPYSESMIKEFYNEMLEILPFVPYDFQEKAFCESLMYQKQINIMSTSSGKSLTISLIIEFLRRQGKKGLLLVPNINLLTQFKADIEEYNLNELAEDCRVIGGGETVRIFDKTLTISTWQSLQGYEHLVDDLDFVICDELQYYASDVTSEIVASTYNCKMKLGFTGTLPEDKCKKMTLLGLFGYPKTYITPRQLIDRGLATPISIRALEMHYTAEEKFEHDLMSNYPAKLKFIKEHSLRNRFVVELMGKLRKCGTSMALFQHTDHGKLLFTDLMKQLHPNVEVKNKNITGKKSFAFQEQYGIYFLNGEDDAKTREKTRKILELDSFKLHLEDGTYIRLNQNEYVTLSDKSTKRVSELSVNDDICEKYIAKLIKNIG